MKKRMKKLLTIAFAAVAGGAFAQDWQVSENIALTADTTVDALTVNSGVTLDLNGYKLTCTSLAGEGTITSTYSDLTQPDGTFTMATPSAYYKGPVGNLFNNNTYYSQGDNDRLLLNLGTAAQKLPLRIDYDFGEGNAKKVNAYKFYAAWSQRAPKAWTLYGSNDSSAYNSASDDGWTEIMSVSGENRWSKGSGKDYEAEALSYTCDNTTAYRYYRLKITEHVGSNNYFELVQLEYFDKTPGELHLNVASGSTAWPSSITFSGNVKVVKDGAGTLTTTGNGDLNLNDVSLYIENGAVTVGNYMRIGYSAGKSADVVVNGGSLSVPSKRLIVGHSGTGTLTINGGTVSVSSSQDTYFAYNKGASGTINLNGGTLITRRVLKNNGSSYTLNFNGGTLQTTDPVSQNGIIGDGITVNVLENGGTIDSGNQSDATSGSRVFIASAIDGTGAMRFKGGKTINIEGAMGWTGGTTVELGTRLYVADNANSATTKSTVLGALAVDGITYTEDTADIPVFVSAAGGLTDSDLANITFANCDATTAAELADDTTIQVDFVAPAWKLTADTTWSALVATYGTPAADATVVIKADTDCTLTIDTDATVGELVFTGSGSVTLAVSSDQTLTADDITGVGAISNSGTIVKTGSGTATIPFDNAATGVVVVNAGTLKVASQTGTGTAYTVRVKGGATFDMNGVRDTTVKVILEEGAFFVNTGGNIGHSNQQAVSITLEGNATATASGGDFGLIAPGYGATTLNLGSYTLTIQGGNTFRLCNTTIIGTGKISVTDSGKLTVKGSSDSDSGKYSCVGENCELVMGSGTTLTVGNYQSLTVKDFTNGGTISTSQSGKLVVKGTLTPGGDIAYLTLASGATVKATGTAQIVSPAFTASGTITVDASDITKAQIAAATDERIPVLSVPASFNHSAVTWAVSGTDGFSAKAKWVDDEGGTTKTLYLALPKGLTIIFK